MFGYNEKCNLCIVNALDLSLPIDNDFKIPKNVVQVSVFEYIDGINPGGYSVFNIYIGEIKKLGEFISTVNYDPKSFGIMERLDKRVLLEDNICYYTNKKNTKIIYTKVNEQDIVVKNLDEMKEVIINISEEFRNIKSSINNIKTLSKKNREVLWII